MNSVFLKIIVWFVTLALIIVGLIYFSYGQNRRWLATGWFEPKLTEEAAKNQQQNQTAIVDAQNSQVAAVRPINSDDHYAGDLSAPLQLIIYTDYDCPFCQTYHQTVKELMKLYPEKLVIAWRHYPLDSHQQALPTAQAVECAAEQDKFNQMQNELYTIQGKNDTAGILAVADKIGLDIAIFKTCLLSEKYLAKILEQKAEAKTFGVIGTPTSFLDGKLLPGAYQLADFIDSAGQERDGLRTLIDQQLN